MRLIVAVVVVTTGCERRADKPAADVSCTPKRHALHVRSVPPTQGEQLTYEEHVAYNFPAANGARSDFETTETVTSVRDQQAQEREVRLNRGSFQGPGMPAPVEVTGRVIRIRVENNKSVFRENGQPLAPDLQQAVEAYDRHDVGQAFWMTRLFTDRTLRLGVETAVELERGLGNDPTAARITLRRLDATSATFDTAVHLGDGKGSPPLTAHGQVVLDITRSRVVAADLTGEFDLPAAQKQQTGLDGTITVKQRFTYAHAAPATSPAECSD
jgi:hypothetical protein